jgi:hypothetical protein
MNDMVVLPSSVEVPTAVTKRMYDFLENFSPNEQKDGAKLFLYLDEKSGAFYVACHLEGRG